MDPLQWTMCILGGLFGSGVLCCICKWPIEKIDNEIVYGEGCCNRYFGWCVSKPRTIEQV